MPLIVSAHFPRSTILKPISFLTRREWLLSPIQALSLQPPADPWWPLTKRQRLAGCGKKKQGSNFERFGERELNDLRANFRST